MPAAYFYSSTSGTYTLTGSISNSATSVTLSSVSGLPASLPFKVVIDPGQGAEEIVKVTAVAGATLTVVRGWDGSTATAHSAGAQVRHMMTAEDLNLSRTHEAASSGVHGATGSVVGTTDTQALTNKNLTSGTNTFPSSLATDTEVSAAVTAHNVATGVHGVGAGNVVSTSAAQTLTNKTINAPALTGATTAESLAVTNSLGVAVVPLTVKGQAGQTGDHIQVKDSGGTVLWKVNKDGLGLGPNDSAWQDFTPSAFQNMGTTPSALSASVDYARYRRSGNTIHAHVGMTLTATSTGGVGVSLPVAARDRLLTCGSAGLFGTSTPADQSGIAYMASSKDKLVIVAFTQGFRDGTSGQQIRYSVTYEV